MRDIFWRNPNPLILDSEDNAFFLAGQVKLDGAQLRTKKRTIDGTVTRPAFNSSFSVSDRSGLAQLVFLKNGRF